MPGAEVNGLTDQLDQEEGRVGVRIENRPKNHKWRRRRRAEHTYGVWVEGKGRKGGIGEALGVHAWPRQIAMRARHVAVSGSCYRYNSTHLPSLVF